MKYAIRADVGCLAASILVLTACGSNTEEGSLPQDVTTAIESSLNRSDVAGCTAHFTDDAEVMAEDAPVARGRQAIEAFCEAQVARDLAFDTDSTMSTVSGDLAAEQGTYRVRNVKAGTNVEYGAYLNVWKKIDGQWKIFRSMFNATQGPAADVSVSESDPTKE